MISVKKKNCLCVNSDSLEKSAIMTEEDKHRVPLFDGSNYNNWKFKMEVLLEEIGLKHMSIHGS